jgi:hypothetical protein
MSVDVCEAIEVLEILGKTVFIYILYRFSYLNKR